MAHVKEQQHHRMRATEKKMIRRNRVGGVFLPGLWTARVLRGLTQHELAEKAQLGYTTVHLLENQHRGARPKTLKKLSEALGIEPADLICPETIPSINEGVDHAQN